MSASGETTIYDVGLHNGDDSEYYLKKGYRVVGIDADATQCKLSEARFEHEIRSGQMVVLNVGVGSAEGTGEFFCNGANSRINTFVPQDVSGGEWEIRRVPVQRLSSIIREYGPAHYVKIDVELYDHLVLSDLWENGIHPSYISAESHLIDVFCALVSMRYERFKIIEGCTVSQRFSDHPILTRGGAVIRHTFPARSSGPFGEDIPGEWFDKSACWKRLMDRGMGWLDIHARA